MRVTIHAVDFRRHVIEPVLDEFEVSGFGVAHDIGTRVANALHRAPAGTDHLTVTVRGLPVRAGEGTAT